MKRLIIIVFIMFIMTFTIKGQENISQFEAQVKGVLDQVSPSLVKVISQGHKKYIATGIAIERDFVITNIMVIRNPNQGVYINTTTGEKYPVVVAGMDRNSAIALLKLDKKVLTPIKRAESYEVGDWVALVGAFYKRFPSIYQGLLSSYSDDGVILNAPVAPGASGGAVVNKKGELIGIIRGRIGFSMGPDYIFKDHSAELLLTSPRSQNQDLCFAIPVSRVDRVYKDLKKYGRTKRGWLGVGLFFSGGKVMVDQVTKGSPAEKSGLRLGDIFVSINDKSIREPADVSEIIKELRPQQKVKLQVKREGKTQRLTAVIGDAEERQHLVSSRPQRFPTRSMQETQHFTIPERVETLPKKKNYVLSMSGAGTLGVDVMNLTPELARQFHVKEGYGLMISKIYRDSTAGKAGIKVADILVEVDGRPLKDPSVLRDLLSQAKEKQQVKVKFYREGKIKEISAVPEISRGYNLFFDQFKNKMQELNIRIAEKNTGGMDGIIRIQGQKFYFNGREYDLEKIDQYKLDIKKLESEKVFLKNKIEKLEETLKKKRD